MSDSRFTIAAGGAEDTATAAAIVRQAFQRVRQWYPEVADLTADGLGMMLQTGSALLLAKRDEAPVGGARYWPDDEGTMWFDLLASVHPGAGHALLRAIEQRAQDAGLRYVRTRLPEDGRTPDVFRFWGYLGVARVQSGAASLLEVERRVPLLTVRETRREDAEAIAALTGEDAWPFTQGTRPGWFVAADGERVIGVAHMAERAGSEATLASPVLLPAYSGRGIEVWMLERAAEWAGRHGASVIGVQADPIVAPLGRDLEDRGWFRDDGPPLRYLKRPGGVLRALDEPWMDD